MANAFDDFDVPTNAFDGFDVEPTKQPVQKVVDNSGFYMDKAKQGVADLGVMTAMPVDGVTDIYNEIIRRTNIRIGDKIPVIEDSFYGTKYVSKVTKDALGIQDLQPADDMEAMIGEGIRFASGNIAPGAWLISKAPTLIQKAVIGVTEAMSAFLGGAGSVQGGSTAAEVFGEDYRTAGQVVGGLAGALAPVTLSGAAIEGANRLRRLASADFQKEMGTNLAAVQLQKEISEYSDAVSNLNKAQKLSKNIPGFSPSLGRSTGAASIISTENRLAENSAHNLAQAQNADRMSKLAISAKLRQDFPKAGVNIANAPQTLLRKTAANLNSKLAQNNKTIEVLNQAFVARPTEAIGARLRVLKDESEVLVRAVSNMNYSNVYQTAVSSGFKENTQSLVEFARTTIGDRATAFQAQSSVFSDIMSKYGKGQGSKFGANLMPKNAFQDISFEELHSLMKRTNKEFYGNIDPTVKSGLGELKMFLSRKIDSYKDVEQYGNLAIQLRQADKYWLNEYKNVFKEGAGAKMSTYNKYGDVTPDEKIVTNIFLGRADGMSDFNKIYGKSPEATKLLEDGVLDAFTRFAKGTGDEVISTAKAHTFFKNNDAALTNLPEVYSLLKDKVKAIEAIQARKDVLQIKLKALNNSRLAALSGMRDTMTLTKKAIVDRRSMGAFIKSVPNESLRRSAIADLVVSQANPHKYLLDNLETIAMGFNGTFGRKHLVNLKRIAEAMEIQVRSTVPTRVSTSLVGKDPLERRLGTSIKSAFSQFRAAAQGRVSQEYIISDIVGKAIFKVRQEQANKLLQEAYYDPELAAHLSKLSVEPIKIDTGTINFLKARLAITSTTTVAHTTAEDQNID